MRIRLVVATVVAIIVATAATADDSGRQYFAPPAGAGASLPFSEAVMVGDTLYVAGHIGLDPKTQ